MLDPSVEGTVIYGVIDGVCALELVLMQEGVRRLKVHNLMVCLTDVGLLNVHKTPPHTQHLGFSVAQC